MVCKEFPDVSNFPVKPWKYSLKWSYNCGKTQDRVRGHAHTAVPYWPVQGATLPALGIRYLLTWVETSCAHECKWFWLFYIYNAKKKKRTATNMFWQRLVHQPKRLVKTCFQKFVVLFLHCITLGPAWRRWYALSLSLYIYIPCLTFAFWLVCVLASTSSSILDNSILYLPWNFALCIAFVLMPWCEWAVSCDLNFWKYHHPEIISYYIFFFM